MEEHPQFCIHINVTSYFFSDLHIGLTRGLRNVKHIEVTEGATQEVCLGFLNGTYVSSDFIELNVSVSETEAGTLGSSILNIYL